MHIMQSRRELLAALSATAAAGLVGPRTSLAAEGPPETTTIRLSQDPTICIAPSYIAENLLRAEGLTDVRYITTPGLEPIVRGDVDFDSATAALVVSSLDAGKPITALAGIHSGCYELFAHEPIRTISDLKGRKIGVPQRVGSSGHLLLAVMTAQVGLDPHRDIEWVIDPSGDFMEPFVQRQVDAFLAFPPEPQKLRARQIGRVILNTATDPPWSQYLCCILIGNRAFVRDNPVATKRALRAILKAAEICASDPKWAAQRLVDGGFTERYDYALQTLTEIPYASWREFDPEDALRFYALRLHEVHFIENSPNEILAEGTDWRFLNELKRELKA